MSNILTNGSESQQKTKRPYNRSGMYAGRNAAKQATNGHVNGNVIHKLPGQPGRKHQDPFTENGQPVATNKAGEVVPIFKKSELSAVTFSREVMGMEKIIIQNAKEKIAQLESQKEKLTPDYNDKEQFYKEAYKEFMDVKLQMDSLDEQIGKETEIINAFDKFRDAPGNSLLKRIEKTNLEQSKPSKEGRVFRVKWNEEAAKVLKEKDIFMSPQEIFMEFTKIPRIVELANQSKTGFGNMKWVIFEGLKRHAKKAKNKLERSSNQLLAMYEGKIGLDSWVTASGELAHPKHLKAFMG